VAVLLRLFKNVYGEYADKRQVRLDALEATADARQLGSRETGNREFGGAVVLLTIGKYRNGQGRRIKHGTDLAQALKAPDFA
jgi:hypothetical protein